MRSIPIALKEKLEGQFAEAERLTATIREKLAEVGVVGEEEGTKPRKVLMTETEFEQLVEEIL